jgi:hypothetical protein
VTDPVLNDRPSGNLVPNRPELKGGTP